MNLKRFNWEPYLLLLPSALYLVFFLAWPMFQAFGLAFQADDGHLTLDYMQRMFSDVMFSAALINTVKLIIAIVPLQFILALVMALLMMERLRGSDILVYIYSIPLAISDLAAGIIWFSIFTQRGYLNSLLYGLGVLDKPFLFLNYQSNWPFAAIVLAEVWRATSIVFVILVAGLQSIPRDYAEAAEVFGANLVVRGLVYLVAVLIALWILIPIYLITIAAFSPKDVIYSWPKSLFPQTISLETLKFFVSAQYVLPSLRNSVVVALLTLVISLVIGAPAGYALGLSHRHPFHSTGGHLYEMGSV